jgi:hypothetical protein
MLKQLLHRPRSMLIQRNSHNRRRNNLDQLGPLRIITRLQQLLTQIIPKRITHQVGEIGLGTLVNNLDRVLVAGTEFGLQVSTAILIAAQVRDFSGKVLDSGFGEDAAFIVVASVAFMTVSAAARGRATAAGLVALVGVVLGSVVVAGIVGGLEMAGRIGLVICVVTS